MLYKNIFLLVVSIFTIGRTLHAQENVVVSSPNGEVKMCVGVTAGNPWYTVLYKSDTLVLPSVLGLEMDGNPFSNLGISEIQSYGIDSTWIPIYGEKSQYREHFQGMNISFSHLDKDRAFGLEIKVFDAGISFRYVVKSEVHTRILSEQTTFNIDPQATAWISTTAQGEMSKVSIVEIQKQVVERPLLVELSSNRYLAIGEAGLYDFARMKLKRSDTGMGLQAALEGEVEFDGDFESPWRFVMVGESPNVLLENNHLLLNLSPPNQIGATDWIRPGKVIREVTLTTQGGMACVDFAAKYGLQYVEFDAGWYGNEYDDVSDATTITVDPKRSPGPLDLHKVVAYAKTKDIGIILYINRRAMEKQLEEVLPLLHSWGIQGVKYGFVRVGEQKWTKWMHDAVLLAAKHQLMVDIHDEYRPTGMSRTYPNLLTQEGIRGDEESPDNTTVLKTIYTRMLAGAGDHTICYFADRVIEMGSHASQLAKAVCVYSPWQFVYWYDRPIGSPGKTGGAGNNNVFIEEIDDLGFFESVPTVWDDTKVLEGYPGEYNVTVRKSKGDWFLGAINGNTVRKIDLELNFLSPGQLYEATIYADNYKVDSKTHIEVTKIRVRSDSKFSFDLNAKKGIAMVFKKL